jgi:hypothetical protein
MTVTLILLKMLHLTALVFGAAASLGNIYILLAKGPHDLPAPEFANALRKWFRLSALGAIVVLWATGLLLTVLRHGWPSGPAFNIKLTLATLLLAIIVYLNLRAGYWARRGGPPPYVPYLHGIGAASLLLTVMFAVAAFG